MEYKKLELGGKKLYQHNLYFTGTAENNNKYYASVSYIDNNPLATNNTLQPLIDFLSTNGFTNMSSLYNINGIAVNGSQVIGAFNNGSNLIFRYWYAGSLSTFSINPTDFNFINDVVIQLN